MNKIFLVVGLVLGCFSGCANPADSTNSSPTDSSSCEHTYEWIPSESSHYKQYTCGCPSPDIAELHYDNDENGFCDVCGYSTVVKMQLSHIMQCLPFEYNLDYFCEKYNLKIDEGYLVIDNATDYCEMLDDVGVPYEGPFDFIFEDSVMLCYLRAVSGSTDFIGVEYYFDGTTNEIIRETLFKPEPDTAYPDVLICECVDIVCVPKSIFEKLG